MKEGQSVYTQTYMNDRENFRASLNPNDPVDRAGLEMFTEHDAEIASMCRWWNFACFIFPLGIILHIVALFLVITRL